jgi:hypothetical protein
MSLTSQEAKRKRDAARECFRPLEIRFLFVAESPPSAPERFFYFYPVEQKDGLFVETMKVLYQVCDVPKLRENKKQYLERFRNDGFFLIDAVDEPIPEGSSKSGAVLGDLSRLKQKLRRLCSNANTKAILISASVYGIVECLKKDGFNIINTEMIDFPTFGRQKLFRNKLHRLLEDHGGIPSRAHC